MFLLLSISVNFEEYELIHMLCEITIWVRCDTHVHKDGESEDLHRNKE